MKVLKMFKKQKIKNGTAKVLSFFAGDAHFVLKTGADGVARSEAYLVHKLTGKAKTAVIEDRHNRTEATQDKIKEASRLFKESIRRKLPNSKFATDTVYDAEMNND
jgi:hypothetical protein